MTPRIRCATRDSATHRFAFPTKSQISADFEVGNPNKVISELNNQACTPPVNASPPPYGKPTHDSGPQLIANLYHAGTFTPYSLPAFTGAFDLTPF